MATQNQLQQQQPVSVGSSHNVVGVHYRVGKKIGEGSFGIIYEGMERTISFHSDSQTN